MSWLQIGLGVAPQHRHLFPSFILLLLFQREKRRFPQVRAHAAILPGGRTPPRNSFEQCKPFLLRLSWATGTVLFALPLPHVQVEQWDGTRLGGHVAGGKGQDPTVSCRKMGGRFGSGQVLEFHEEVVRVFLEAERLQEEAYVKSALVGLVCAALRGLKRKSEHSVFVSALCHFNNN